MAIYHLHVKAVQRSKGRSATAAAAYRAGELVACEREGRDHDYTLKRGVAHSQIIGWDGSREELWNAAEAAERQKNATVAKEYELAFPTELGRDDQIALAERFGQWLHERHGVAVDIACHDLHSSNPHAHIMTTTRPVTEDGAGLEPVKAQVEWADKKRKQHGLPGRKTELDAARREWSEIANAALAESGAKARIDHRSLKEQGIDRPPQVHEGPTVRKIEAKAQRRAEQRGVEYKPVTIKGQMNQDAREIAQIQLDLDALRAECEAEAVEAAVRAEDAREADFLAARQSREAEWREQEQVAEAETADQVRREAEARDQRARREPQEVLIQPVTAPEPAEDNTAALWASQAEIITRYQVQMQVAETIARVPPQGATDRQVAAALYRIGRDLEWEHQWFSVSDGIAHEVIAMAIEDGRLWDISFKTDSAAELLEQARTEHPEMIPEFEDPLGEPPQRPSNGPDFGL